MNLINIIDHLNMPLVDSEISKPVDTKAVAEKTHFIYMDTNFFPSPITINSLTSEPDFESNIDVNGILLRETLEGLNLLLKENLISLKTYREYYTSLKDKFEINRFVCENLEDLLSINQFESVSYKNQDSESIVTRNIQKFNLLNKKLVEMENLGFIGKKIHEDAQKILTKNFAASDKRTYNMELN
jgi:hypothetical protein